MSPVIIKNKNLLILLDIIKPFFTSKHYKVKIHKTGGQWVGSVKFMGRGYNA